MPVRTGLKMEGPHNHPAVAPLTRHIRSSHVSLALKSIDFETQHQFSKCFLGEKTPQETSKNAHRLRSTSDIRN